MSVVTAGNEAVCELRGRLTGFENNDGSAAATPVNEPEHFLSREQAPLRNARLPIESLSANWTLTDLPCATDAIRSYHDTDGNGETHSNRCGIPREDCSISNNARGTLGPPDFDQVSFRLEAPITDRNQTETPAGQKRCIE